MARKQRHPDVRFSSAEAALSDLLSRCENILTDEQLDVVFKDGKSIRGQILAYRFALKESLA